MKVTITTKGLKDIPARLAAFQAAMDGVQDEALTKIANEVYNEARLLAPIDEGNLKRSVYVIRNKGKLRTKGGGQFITRRGPQHLGKLQTTWNAAMEEAQQEVMGKHDKIARVGAAAYYAAAVHEGHHTVPARQFLTMALDLVAVRIPGIVKYTIERARQRKWRGRGTEEFTIE